MFLRSLALSLPPTPFISHSLSFCLSLPRPFLPPYSLPTPSSPPPLSLVLTWGSPKQAITLPRSCMRPTRWNQSLSGCACRMRSAVWKACTEFGLSVSGSHSSTKLFRHSNASMIVIFPWSKRVQDCNWNWKIRKSFNYQRSAIHFTKQKQKLPSLQIRWRIS